VIVRRLVEIEGSDREVSAETWTSRRFVLADDGVGFSLHDTVLDAGTVTDMWYRNHVEAVYCIDGAGELEDLGSGARWTIEPGTMYLLDGHERHRLTVHRDLRAICVFTPPCTGREVHDADGAYPLLGVAEHADGSARL
jgi:L-ectoine synthase